MPDMGVQEGLSHNLTTFYLCFSGHGKPFIPKFKLVISDSPKKGVTLKHRGLKMATFQGRGRGRSKTQEGQCEGTEPELGLLRILQSANTKA